MPDSFRDVLGLLVLNWAVSGIVIAAGLEMLWPAWTKRTGRPIRPHDKVLIAALLPPAVTLSAWALGAGLGYFAWSWDAAWHALQNGGVAAVGGQVAFGTARKLTAPPPSVTTIGTVQAERDVYVGSVVRDDDPPVEKP